MGFWASGWKELSYLYGIPSLALRFLSGKHHIFVPSAWRTTHSFIDHYGQQINHKVYNTRDVRNELLISIWRLQISS